MDHILDQVSCSNAAFALHAGYFIVAQLGLEGYQHESLIIDYQYIIGGNCDFGLFTCFSDHIIGRLSDSARYLILD